MNLKLNGFLALTLLIGISVCAANPVPISLLSAGNCDLARILPAQLTDVTRPGDIVVGVPNIPSEWPSNESPPLAIDNNTSTKYLHFDGQYKSTGFQVTPSAGKTVVVGLTFTTANDAPERDPIAYELYGSNTSISGPYTLIASGEITDFKQASVWPRFTMNTTPIRFSNSTSYLHYQVMFPTVRNPGSANSMQIGEVELLGGPEGGWPPEVNAGTDQVMILPNSTLQLDGTVTYYGSHPELLTIEWSLASAPSGVTFDDVRFEPNAASEDPKVILPQVPGVYSLRLYATDGTTEAEDTVQIALAESVYPTGDLNHDCIVNLADLLLLTSGWTSNPGGTGSNPADLNGQDGINLSDFSLMAANWLIESPQVIINEFMAINNSKFDDFQNLSEGEWVDEDGDSSDWIELLNVTNQPIFLNGWYLTNNPDQPKGWELPDVSLEPGAFLIIAASGKDRNDPDGQLHTDFQLAGESGFIALVKPDGKTVVHSYMYPQQFAGISYGLMTPLSVSKTLELVGEPAAAYAKVPTDSSLGLSWISPDFVPTGWKTGNTGVGFDTESAYIPLIGLDVSEMYNVNASVYIRIPFEINDLTGLKNLTLQMKYDDGFIAYLNSTTPIQSANAPSSPTWYSGSTNSHADSLAVNFVDYPLADDTLANLRVGKNVLAIHGLNRQSGNGDMLISPRLTVQQTTISSTLSAVTGFMPQPTPNDNNASGLANLGPTIRNVTENPTPPAAATALPITAEIASTMSPINSVQLHYRVNFGAESKIAMRDDGAGGDATAGDGIYTASIPGAAAGQMVRWYVTATDINAVQTREPMFLDPTNSPEYFGTVVVDPSISSKIGVFWYFVQNTSAEGTDTGTRASVFYLNEFYDNVFIRLRGGYTTHGRKIAFNDGHFFRFDPNQDRVDEINLNEQGADPTYIRPMLSWETYILAGHPASLSFPLHVMRNGSFYAIRIFVEQPDRHFLRRVG
ncbi:MAG: hypothetical protein GX455_01575, partial [Phycisphaerae bacterium]|nr:hypothetical protein [Phycisphaerae bacterium]